MCCHFSVPLFDSKKNSFVQKVSKSCRKFRLFKFRRVPISVYTEIPLLLGSSLDAFEKVVTARHSLISFWQNEFSAHPNLLICGRNVIHWGSRLGHMMIACWRNEFNWQLVFLLGVHVFCEFLGPLVSKSDGGSEFLTRNWFWEWFLIHLIKANISRRQVL